MKEILTKQIETYSNSIVAFNVLQGLAYLYYFGSNATFNLHVKTSNWLAEIIAINFIIITILSIISIKYLGNRMAELIAEHKNILAAVTRGKIVIVSIFGFFSVFVTIYYGA